MKYKVNDIFGPTIQGEGSHSGTPVLFLRLAGCNKRCSFCDTNYHPYLEKTKEEILGNLRSLSRAIDTVIITGGEPMQQLDVTLAKYLSDNGLSLHIETNGSIKLGDVSKYLKHVSVSPKQTCKNTLIERAEDIKFLYPLLEESEIDLFKRKFKDSSIYVQPIENHSYGENLKNSLELVFKKNIKLSVQIHKLIGVK